MEELIKTEIRTFKNILSPEQKDNILMPNRELKIKVLVFKVFSA